jgi:hypothetical protein
MRAPRTRFAASFVAIVAAGCGSKSAPQEPSPEPAHGPAHEAKPTDNAPPPPPASIDAAAAPVADITRVWSLSKDPHGACSYFEDPCSKLQRAPGEPIPPCNPPPMKPIECPPYVDATMGAQVVQHHDGTCTVTSTGARVDCLP